MLSLMQTSREFTAAHPGTSRHASLAAARLWGLLAAQSSAPAACTHHAHKLDRPWKECLRRASKCRPCSAICHVKHKLWKRCLQRARRYGPCSATCHDKAWAGPPRDQPAATRTESGYFCRTKATTSLHRRARTESRSCAGHSVGAGGQSVSTRQPVTSVPCNCCASLSARTPWPLVAPEIEHASSDCTCMRHVPQSHCQRTYLSGAGALTSDTTALLALHSMRSSSCLQLLT